MFFSDGDSRRLSHELLDFFLLADDDFLDAFRRDRLDVGAVGELRVGHDGGRVGVDEHDAVAFLLERLAGLRAGIIKLARLADDDRAGADDEDAVDVSALGHSSNGEDETRIALRTKEKSRHVRLKTWRRLGFTPPASRCWVFP